MKEFTKILIILIAFLPSLAFGQSDKWLNYTYGDCITGMAEEGNYVWTSTIGGLVKTNKDNRESYFYTCANSDLQINSSSAITVGHDGTKWMVSGNYIIKLAGSLMTKYKIDDLGVPIGDGITCLASDATGNLWFGYGLGNQSNYGLGKFDGSETVFYTVENSGLPHNSVNTIMIDEDGIIWIGTDKGLAKLDGTNWTVYDNMNSLIAGNNIYDVDIDDKGNKWVTCFNGITMFNDTTWITYNKNNTPLPHDFLRTLTIDSEGNKWIGINKYENDGALAKFNDTTWTIFTKENSGLPHNAIVSIIEVRPGKMWIGTFEGLTEFNGTTWEKIETSNSELEINLIDDIVIDSQGDKWIANGEGVAFFNNYQWNIYNHNNSILPHSDTYFIAIDSSDKKWIGMGMNFAGVATFKDTSWSLITVPEARTNKILVARDNKVWCATSAGLFVYDGNAWVNYIKANSGIAGDYVYDLGEDKNGKIWIATHTGLSSFDGSTWTTYNMDNSPIPDEIINVVAVEPDGIVWIAFNWFAKFAKFDGINWTFYDQSNTVGVNDIYVSEIAIDSTGDKWFGTNVGLIHLNGDTYSLIKADDQGSGLPETTIYDIEFDRFNNKWLATRDGVIVYNENGILLSTPDKESKTGNLKVYPNPANNLLTVELNESCNKVTVEIINSLGMVVKQSVFSGKRVTIPVDELHVGLYILLVSSDKGTISSKVIIE